MKIIRAVVILALFEAVLAFSACSGDNGMANIHSEAQNSTSRLENANSAKNNVEELSLLINLPYVPEDEDIVWKTDAVHKRLTAVWRFSQEDANSFITEASKIRTPQETTLSSEPWFPPELIAQSDMSGDDSLRGIAYAANSFFQEPYTSGQIVRVDATDFFVLELSAR